LSMDVSLATAQGLSHATVLWDIRSFYEHVQFPKAAEAALSQGMPATPTALARLGHAMPRVLTLRGFFAKRSLTPSRSLATGCQSSTSFARALTKQPLLAAAAEGGKLLKQSVHVDDIGQEATGEPGEIFECLSKAGLSLVQELNDLGLEMSPKSQLLCSDMNLAKRLRKTFLQEAGVQIIIEDSAAHLGHGRTHERGKLFRHCEAGSSRHIGGR